MFKVQGLVRFCLLLAVLACLPNAAFGQADRSGVPTPTPAAVAIDEPAEAESWKLKRGAKEIGFEIGFAPMQPTFFSGAKEYDTDGRKFATASIRFGRVIGTHKGVTYEYLFEAIPIALAIKNEVKNPAFVSDEETPNEPYTIRENTYGFAVMPAGFRFIFMPKRRLKPYVQTAAGSIFTKKPIPVPESPAYNFAGAASVGLMYSVKKRQTINFGYRYFHISNMNIGEMNPGYNASIFYIGYSFFSK